MKEFLKWEDNKLPVKIGRMGENEYTQVVIDCSVVFSEFPSAIPAMTIQPPSGDAYPVIATRDGNNVVWVVKDSDLSQQGFGEMQVTFTSDNVVVKSCIWRTSISKSLTPTGEAPTPIEDWLVEANTALNAIPQTIDDALQEAKDSGEFDGKDGDPGQDGFSPIITVTDIAGGHRVTITDATGSKTVDVMDGEPGDPGEPGADGVSPTVAVSPITDGHRVTITDKTGSHSFDVMDGEKGDPGDPTELIDDSSTAANKAWSASKTSSEVSDLKIYLNYLTFLLCRIIPKKKNRWIFGAWYGNRVSDNPYALYNYIKKTHSNIDCIWICNNIEEAEKKGIKAIRRNSFAAIWNCLTARVSVMNQGYLDFGDYNWIFGSYKVQLWHGVPWKKIGEDSSNLKTGLFHRISHKAFLFASRYNLYISPSEETRKILKTDFKSKGGCGWFPGII